MKLSIKKEYFDEILYGSKVFEYRDAHITFVCEKTKRKLRKNICGIKLKSVDGVPDKYKGKGLFEDDTIIEFMLEES